MQCLWQPDHKKHNIRYFPITTIKTSNKQNNNSHIKLPQYQQHKINTFQKNLKLLSLTHNLKLLSLTHNLTLLSLTHNLKLLSLTHNLKLLSLTHNLRLLPLTHNHSCETAAELCSIKTSRYKHFIYSQIKQNSLAMKCNSDNGTVKRYSQVLKDITA